MKFKIFSFKKVTSTNDIAINFIKKRKKEIGCICADEQSKGRGRYGKRWVSDKGNIFTSLFFPLKKNYPKFNEFSAINPILISKVIKSFCKNKKISLKFPNDIMIDNKKVCGLLQELITLNNKKFLIIGIGINIISNPGSQSNYETTNIFLETKKKVNKKKIIKLIVSSYENFFINIKSYQYINFKKKRIYQI
jgi:BirA family biotin operon repressor/biotin-[acetyl-CoA-carboxylase] ligase